MKVLKNLIEKAEDTMEEIEWYAEKAHALKDDRRALADAYIKIAEMHLAIYGILHERMVALINEEKSKGTQPPQAMLAIWEYSHEKLIKQYAELKFLVEDYKKSY